MFKRGDWVIITKTGCSDGRCSPFANKGCTGTKGTIQEVRHGGESFYVDFKGKGYCDFKKDCIIALAGKLEELE